METVMKLLSLQRRAFFWLAGWIYGCEKLYTDKENMKGN